MRGYEDEWTGWWASYQLNECVRVWGTHVQNKLDEAAMSREKIDLDQVLADLLDDTTVSEVKSYQAFKRLSKVKQRKVN